MSKYLMPKDGLQLDRQSSVSTTAVHIEKFTSPSHTIKDAMDPLIAKRRQYDLSSIYENSNIAATKNEALLVSNMPRYEKAILSEYVKN